MIYLQIVRSMLLYVFVNIQPRVKLYFIPWYVFWSRNGNPLLINIAIFRLPDTRTKPRMIAESALHSTSRDYITDELHALDAVACIRSEELF